MLIIYNTFTGNTKRFLDKTGYKSTDLSSMESNSVVQDRFLLMTGTLGFGHAPARVQRFLELNANNCIGVVASGNRNWGQNFAGAANEINRLYGIPIIMKFELSGTTEEVNLFKKKVAKLFNGK